MREEEPDFLQFVHNFHPFSPVDNEPASNLQPQSKIWFHGQKKLGLIDKKNHPVRGNIAGKVKEIWDQSAVKVQGFLRLVYEERLMTKM
ncbi:hypothetical protein QJS10_CPB15g01841 [Acorus calamus]|uniref:Uncharacterized protein n=1 Tax=Acorus calamus TaxID=4465 RepID=A0AAV9D4V7_ACOCL|nr:hypothetical protein QJS10_CPB15g01841 [Acorus calamus]